MHMHVYMYEHERSVPKIIQPKAGVAIVTKHVMFVKYVSSLVT
jgi:hypothetical protein